MIFSLIVLLMIGVIAFFHYVQGLFSATLSAILTIIAAVFAVSYHEQVVALIMKGNLADSAHAIVLVSLFAMIYIVLRLIFDRSIQGNVRYPLIVDKVGAGVMGLIAGVFATGVFAMAAQLLPFGAKIAQYARFEVADRDVRVPAVTSSAQTDSFVFMELKDPEDPLNPDKALGMIVPADDMLIAMVNKLSDGGSLAGARPLAAIHPNWMNEIFASRLGIQEGTRRVVINIPSRQELKQVDAVFSFPQVDEIDAEFAQIRGEAFMQVKKKGGDVLKPGADQILLGVRCDFDINASDDDKMMRISPGAVRLLGVKDDGGAKLYTNYHPLGTADGTTLYRNRPDDPIVVNLAGEGVVDFVFLVNRSDVLEKADPKSGEMKIKAGVFFEAKRNGRIELAGKPVGTPPDDDRKSQVVRKELEKAGEGKQGGRESNAPVAMNAPVLVKTIALNAQLFSAINAGSYSGDTANLTLTSGTAVIRNKKYDKLKIDGTEPLARLGAGDFAYKDLFAPPDKRIVQVAMTPTGEDAWKWAEELGKWEMVDGAGRKYKPNGAFARIKNANGGETMVAQYDAESQIDGIPRPEGGRPTEVWFAFVLPAGENVKDFLFEGKSLKRVNIELK